MTPLYLDFAHDADSAHVYHQTLTMVTFYLYFTDEFTVKYVLLKSSERKSMGQILHQWEYKVSDAPSKTYLTMASKGFGFPDPDPAVPVAKLADLLEDAFNPLQSLMFAHEFAARFSPTIDWVSQWLGTHEPEPFKSLDPAYLGAMEQFSNELTDRLEAMREELEHTVVQCEGVVGA